MKLILANPRGFCAGVYMAIDVVDQLLDIVGDEPIYVYHEIVHNKYVVETFREKGAVFVDRLDEVPPGSHLLFSAHGVSPEVRRVAQQRDLYAIDATCPLVTKVHLEAVRYAKATGLLLPARRRADAAKGGSCSQRLVVVSSWERNDFCVH